MTHKPLCRICRTIIIIIVVAFFIIGVPLLLNSFLQIESPWKCVIGGVDAPKIWLAFWGCYLGAVGSASAAIVALMNGRIDRKRDYYHNLIREENEQYRVLKDEIDGLIIIHSPSRLIEIYRIFCEDPIKALKECNELDLRLNRVIKYGEEYYDFDYGQGFIEVLKKCNILFAQLVFEARSILLTGENDEETKKRELHQLIVKMGSNNELTSLYNDLLTKGLDLLHERRSHIIVLHRRLQKVTFLNGCDE